jgi:hypothetical protein
MSPPVKRRAFPAEALAVEVSTGCPFGSDRQVTLPKPWRTSEDRMDVHKNAPLTPAGREAMVRRVVEDGRTPQAVSAVVGV